MSFTEAVKSVFRNYVNFSGRARRSEYWYFILFTVICSAVFSLLTDVFGGFEYVQDIYTLAIFIPHLALMWRRLHDIGRSGLWVLISLIPVVGWIILLVWYCKDSQPGENQYGPNPKGF